MKKPRPGAPESAWAAYAEWVRGKLKNWDPADDRGGPDVYIPRYDGVRGLPNHPIYGDTDVRSDDDGD